MQPSENEPICLITFEVAKIRLNGGPEERPSFWKVYREEQALNLRTNFENEHVRICLPMLGPIFPLRKIPHYMRKGRLVMEREIKPEVKVAGVLPRGEDA